MSEIGEGSLVRVDIDQYQQWYRKTQYSRDGDQWVLPEHIYRVEVHQLADAATGDEDVCFVRGVNNKTVRWMPTAYLLKVTSLAGVEWVEAALSRMAVLEAAVEVIASGSYNALYEYYDKHHIQLPNEGEEFYRFTLIEHIALQAWQRTRPKA